MCDTVIGPQASEFARQIQRYYNGASRIRLKREILDKLADGHDFAVPPSMVEREFESIWQQIEQDMERAGETWDDADQTEEEARDEYQKIAERRVRLGLLLSEIGQSNNIVVPQEELFLQATMAVRYGLPWEAAIRALTIVPAEGIGIADRTGSLEPGKDADIVLWTGDPLDPRRYVELTMVNGKVAYDAAEGERRF